MRKILDTGVPFTALIASNDLSGIGAMDMLRASGRRIPEDVAVIGFDDILEARSQLPLLTTVRHPTFMLGYQSLLSVLEAINGKKPDEISTRVATQLVIRQSCGCRPESTPVASFDPSTVSDIATFQTTLAHVMAECTFVEVRYSTARK